MSSGNRIWVDKSVVASSLKTATITVVSIPMNYGISTLGGFASHVNSVKKWGAREWEPSPEQCGTRARAKKPVPETQWATSPLSQKFREIQSARELVSQWIVIEITEIEWKFFKVRCYFSIKNTFQKIWSSRVIVYNINKVKKGEKTALRKQFFPLQVGKKLSEQFFAGFFEECHRGCDIVR